MVVIYVHKGLFLNADAGFDSKSLRDFLESKEIIANIKPNPRNGEQPDVYFDEELYKNRFKIEQANGWLDGYKGLIMRYEYLDVTWIGMLLLGFISKFLKKFKHVCYLNLYPMENLTKIICLLMLGWCIGAYAQGETASNDWAKMGLKGKVKSVKTSIYFAEAKDNDFIKGTPFSQGIYPPEKIKQYSEMERMGVKAFFIHFLVNIIPSAITFDKNGFITEKWLYNTVSPKKIVYTYDKKNRLIDKSTFVHDFLETKDTLIYNTKGQLEKEVLDLKTKDETIYTYTYNVDGELIQRNFKKN